MMRTRTAITLVWSAAVWTALWGDLTAANVLSGLAVGAAVVWIVPLDRPAGAGSTVVRVHPLSAARFLLFFAWALVRASAVVAWEVVTPRNRIYQGIIELPLRTRSTGVATIVANAISLTPGTLTLEVFRDPLTLYVHVLHLRNMEAVRRDLRRLEELALRAFDAGSLQEDTP